MLQQATDDHRVGVCIHACCVLAWDTLYVQSDIPSRLWARTMMSYSRGQQPHINYHGTINVVRTHYTVSGTPEILKLENPTQGMRSHILH